MIEREEKTIRIRCNKCGKTITVFKDGKIPVCPNCGGTSFSANQKEVITK